MEKKVTKRPHSKRPGVGQRRPKREVLDKEERIFQKATLHLITKHGGLLVATDLRETRIRGFRVWIITVTLRYPTGHEGYVGDLLYDGKDFTFLTEKSIMDERLQ